MKIELPSWLKILTLPMPGELGYVNCYVIRGSESCALIDTGMSDIGSRAALTRRLNNLGLNIGDIKTVACTHNHPDHCGLGYTFVSQKTDVLMGQDDCDALNLFLENKDSDKERATFFGKHDVPDEFEKRVTPMFPFFRRLQEEFVPTHVVKNGEIINLGGIEFEVISTPGHTRGHVCYLQKEAQLIFTGDHIIPGDATHVSMRRETIGTDPIDKFIKSLLLIKNLGSLVGLGGHGEPIKDISVRAQELISHHYTRLEQIENVLKTQPQTAYDISLKVFVRKKNHFFKWLAMSQAIAYLEHLVVNKKATCIVDNGKYLFTIFKDSRFI